MSGEEDKKNWRDSTLEPKIIKADSSFISRFIYVRDLRDRLLLSTELDDEVKYYILRMYEKLVNGAQILIILAFVFGIGLGWVITSSYYVGWR